MPAKADILVPSGNGDDFNDQAGLAIVLQVVSRGKPAWLAQARVRVTAGTT